MRGVFKPSLTISQVADPESWQRGGGAGAECPKGENQCLRGKRLIFGLFCIFWRQRGGRVPGPLYGGSTTEV